MNESKEKYKNWFIIGAVVLVVIFVLRKLNVFTMITDIINQLPHKGEYRQRSLESIDRIVIHHSASPSGKFTMWDFAKWHIDPAGRLNAPRIAYHFGIDPDGKIYQSNKLTSLSWHAPGANTTGIGIVLNGNFENEQPTDVQIRSLKKLIRYLNNKLGKRLAVFGHREIKGNATACPGKNVNIDQFRNLA